MFHSRWFRAKDECLHAHAVEESGSRCAQNLIDRSDNALCQVGCVNRPEFDQETVHPFQTLGVLLECRFGQFPANIVTKIASYSAKRGAIVRSAGRHDDEDPPQPTPEERNHP